MSAARLHESIAAVCPIDGVSVGTPGDPSTVRIGFQKEATDEQRRAAGRVLKSFDWSDEAQAAADLVAARQLALASLLSRGDDVGIAIRLVMRDVYTQINDLREAAGQPRILEQQILARLQALAAAGWGDPS